MRKTNIAYTKLLVCVLGVIVMAMASGCATIVEGTALMTFGVLVHKAGGSQDLDIYRIPSIA